MIFHSFINYNEIENINQNKTKLKFSIDIHVSIYINVKYIHALIYLFVICYIIYLIC